MCTPNSCTFIAVSIRKKQILIYKAIVYFACEPSLQQLKHFSSPHALVLKLRTGGGVELGCSMEFVCRYVINETILGI